MPTKQKGSGGVFSSSAKVTPAKQALAQAQKQIEKNIKTIESAKNISDRAVSQASVRPTSSRRQAFSRFEDAAEEELKELEKSIRGNGIGSSKFPTVAPSEQTSTQRHRSSSRRSNRVTPAEQALAQMQAEATQSLVDNYSFYKVLTNPEAKKRALSSAAQSARTLVTLTKKNKSKLNPHSEQLIKDVIAKSRKMSALPPITSG